METRSDDPDRAAHVSAAGGSAVHGSAVHGRAFQGRAFQGRAVHGRAVHGRAVHGSLRMRRRAAVAVAVLLTAGMAAGTALLPNPAQAAERPSATVAQTRQPPPGVRESSSAHTQQV